MTQPKLFEQPDKKIDIESVLLYALGDFQSRGKILAGRELALDRLHGAFLRAFDKFGIAERTDEQIADALRALGATVVEIPNYVAKRPYRIKVSTFMADKAAEYYRRNYV